MVHIIVLISLVKNKHEEKIPTEILIQSGFCVRLGNYGACCTTIVK